MKIGDICKCKRGKIGMILSIKTTKDGTILYKGKTLGNTPGLPWQSSKSRKLGDFCEIHKFIERSEDIFSKL